MASDAPFEVVDASVAVKWFITDDESGVAEADLLLQRHINGEVRLAAPSLLVHEVLNVLRRPGRAVPDLPEAMRALFDVGLVLVPPDCALMVRAAELVSEQGLSTFDAAYAALAETFQCVLVTADRGLARAVGERLKTRVV
ncbi:MAG: type II toxin-antitoxin system VapC family toxin [Coriobacteriia bacterium]